MNSDLEHFVKGTQRARSFSMRSKEQLFSRLPSAADWVDACVIGGATLGDALAGRATDADLDSRVVEAFHLQYPRSGDFTGEVRRLGDDPEALRGLVSGVKGKMLETEYVSYLNDGHLPAGQTAELATSATQPGWDVVVHDQSGGVAELMQIKNTDNAAYVREAIERYPEMDVAVPSEAYSSLLASPGLGGNVVNSAVEGEEIADRVHGAVETAADSATLDVFPEFAFAFILASAAWSISRGGNWRAVLPDTGRRFVKAGIAGGAGGLAAFVFDPFVGLPVAVVTRLLMGRRDAARASGRAIEERRQRVVEIHAEVMKERKPGRVRYLPTAALLNRGTTRPGGG